MIPSTRHRRSPADPNSKPYAQLLRALLPRLTGVSIFDAQRRAALVERHGGRAGDVRSSWSSRCSTRSATPGEPGVLRCSDGMSRLYIFWLRRTTTAPIEPGRSRCCCAARPAPARTSAPSPSCTRWCVRRSRSCGREMLRREQISAAERLARRAGPRSGHAAGGQRAAMRPATRRRRRTQGHPARRGRRIQCGLAAIIVPEKGLVLVRRRRPSTPSMPAWWRAPTAT